MATSGRIGRLARVDFLIVGGGPAGSASAIVLARGGARVAIVERSAFRNFRIGETLSPNVTASLNRLGFDRDGLSACVPDGGVVARWGSDEPRGGLPSVFNPYGLGLRVDRVAFDRQLFEFAGRAGVRRLSSATIVSANRESGRWTLSIRRNGRSSTVEAATVVEATGRSSSSPCAPDRTRLRSDKLIGLVRKMDDCPASLSAGDAAASHVESISCGWWYSTVVPDGRLLAVLFTDSDLLPRGAARSEFIRRAIDAAPFLRQRCDRILQAQSRLAWKQFDACTSIRRQPIADGWISVGDALMSFDPLSGRGVLEAMDGGIAAAEMLLRDELATKPAAHAFAQQAADRFNSLLRERAAAYGAERRWLASPFWARRSAPP